MADRVRSCVVRSLKLLLAEARSTGNWGDVRGTADAVLALGTCLPSSSFPNIRRAATRWLISRSVEVAGRRSWEEEVWDTSVALVALASAGEPYVSELGEGVRWLADRQDPEDGHWNEEPWETLWALVAIHAARAATGPIVSAERRLRALDWLIGLVGSPLPGRLVNWHYTGLFTLVASRFLGSDFAPELGAERESRLRAVRDEMVESMRRTLELSGPGGPLWTRETWSNALVLWALSENEGVIDGSPHARLLVSRLGQDLLKEDLMTEDRAFATVAGFHLDVCLETTRDAHVRKVVDRLRSDGEEEAVRSAVAPLLDLLETRAAEQLQQRLASEVGGSETDFIPRPPLLTRQTYPGFYTLNLSQRPVNIALILAVTAGITALALLADLSSGPMRLVLTLVPIGLGVLATIAQIANVNVGSLLKRSRSDGEAGE